MMAKVLLVDDEERILSSYRRTLRKNYQIFTALGGTVGMEVVKEKGPFAVIISDMQMPEMNGIQFLEKVEKHSPDSVRMMLTGNADFQTAHRAVNQGHIFRFLTKPCSPDDLNLAIKEGVRQYELQIAEHELLAKTLRGSIQVMMEIVSTFDPVSFNRVITIRDIVRKLAAPLKLTNLWEIEIGILLSGIGQVAIPAAVISRQNQKQALSSTEQEMIAQIPATGYKLLQKIPRLERVSQIVYYQKHPFTGNGNSGEPSGERIPIGARLLHIISDLIELENEGQLRSKAFEKMAAKKGEYDPHLLKIISRSLSAQSQSSTKDGGKTLQVNLKDLKVGMVLRSSLVTSTGMTLVLAGQKINETLLLRIQNWSKIYQIKEPIQIRMTE